MNYISSNYFEIFMLLWLRDVASLENVCHHGDEHCEEASPDKKYTMETNSGIPADKPKKILYWTHFYGHRDFEFGYGQKPFIEAGCPVSNCIATGMFQLKTVQWPIQRFHRGKTPIREGHAQKYYLTNFLLKTAVNVRT